MALPLYVLLPDGVEWTAMAGTVAQRPSPVRWYLRQHMVEAATQTAVLVSSDEPDPEARVAQVARRASELGGLVVDAATQQVVGPTTPVVH